MFASHAAAGDPAAALTPAPLRDDATIRAKTIAFEESRLGSDADDQLTPRMLAEQYLQRYRERGDVGDVLRAEAAARRSIRVQGRGNLAALRALGAAQLTLHRFHDALVTVRSARAQAPDDPGMAMSEASLDLEVGDYAAARALVGRFGNGDTEATETVASRLAELTGDLSRARTILARAARRTDAIYGAPNERRAWFHVRLAELAFEAGDIDAALAENTIALERFPDDVQARTGRARVWAALERWTDVRTDATQAVRLAPSPENLGLLADAADGLGDAAGARAIRDEIVTIERIGNAQHLVDRLVAIEYADHGVRLEEAYAIARREIALRDDVFAEDTLAWTAARAGHWDAARRAARRATAWNTADARIWYHAGVIAEQAGEVRGALHAYRHALGLNPRFHARHAKDARARARQLEQTIR